MYHYSSTERGVTMKKRLLKIGIPVVIVIGFIIFMVGRSSSPSELANAFEEAVKNENAEGLLELVEVDENVHWGKREAESIIKYLKEEDDDLKDQIMLLDAQTSYYETDGKATNRISQMYPGDNISDIGPFYITEVDGIFGNKYVLKARAYILKVSAVKGTKVTFNGKSFKIDNEESKTLGLFAPGIYTINGQKKYDYTTVQDETTVTLFDIEDFSETASLTLNGRTVTVSSKIPNTKLLVNGKNVNKNIYKGVELGPVKKGLTLQGVVRFPWGKGKSETKTIEDAENEYILTPSPVTDDSMKENIVSVINNYAKNYIKAKVKQNPDILTNVSDNLKKYYTETIEYFDEENYFEGKAIGTRIAFSRVEYEQGSGGIYLLHIPVEFHEKSREVYEYIDTELDSHFREMIVTLKYQKDKSWLIYKEENDYHSNSDTYMTSKEVVKTTF